MKRMNSGGEFTHEQAAEAIATAMAALPRPTDGYYSVGRVVKVAAALLAGPGRRRRARALHALAAVLRATNRPPATTFSYSTHLARPLQTRHRWPAELGGGYLDDGLLIGRVNVKAMRLAGAVRAARRLEGGGNA